eukprot:994210-Pyramimonas_sp.AAC.1
MKSKVREAPMTVKSEMAARAADQRADEDEILVPTDGDDDWGMLDGEVDVSGLVWKCGSTRTTTRGRSSPRTATDRTGSW